MLKLELKKLYTWVYVSIDQDEVIRVSMVYIFIVGREHNFPRIIEIYVLMPISYQTHPFIGISRNVTILEIKLTLNI